MGTFATIAIISSEIEKLDTECPDTDDHAYVTDMQCFRLDQQEYSFSLVLRIRF
jgi:hypothetical protein